MSKKEMIARQFDHACWANGKLLRPAHELTDDQYLGDEESGSLHALFVHTISTEWIWRNLAQTGSLPGPPPSTESLTTLEDVENAWRQEEDSFRNYLAALSDSDLEGSVNTVSPAGDAYAFKRWEMLQHRLLHSMQHRTEAAAQLTLHGRSPGNMDFVFFVIGRE